MPEYLSPGVYIEEVSGPEPIEGVSTSITGFVGVTQRGPFDTNPPVLVTSFPEFAQIFGGYFTPTWSNPPAPTVTPYNLLPHAVAGFFNNGGQLLYIKRVGNGTPMGTTAPAPSQAAELQTGVAGPAGARMGHTSRPDSPHRPMRPRRHCNSRACAASKTAAPFTCKTLRCTATTQLRQPSWQAHLP